MARRNHHASRYGARYPAPTIRTKIQLDVLRGFQGQA